jgi:hypothetical protein
MKTYGRVEVYYALSDLGTRWRNPHCVVKQAHNGHDQHTVPHCRKRHMLVPLRFLLAYMGYSLFYSDPLIEHFSLFLLTFLPTVTASVV